jgi:hypothetical protein
MADLPPASQIVPAEGGVARTASPTLFDTCRAFHSNVTGSVTVTWANGSSTALEVLSGACYAYKIKGFTSGSGTLVTVY